MESRKLKKNTTKPRPTKQMTAERGRERDEESERERNHEKKKIQNLQMKTEQLQAD